MNESIGSMAQQANTAFAAESDRESSWIAASQQGDTLAFNRLVLRWEKRVYSVAFRMLRNQEEAAEATQDVFLLAYRHIRRFRKDAKFSTWIYKIVCNHCLTRLKQRPPGAHFSIEDDAADHAAPQMQVAETQLGELARKEQRDRVLAALGRLQPEQQAVIELKFYQDMTFDEISAALEVPLSTVKSRLYSGLEILKMRLGIED